MSGRFGVAFGATLALVLLALFSASTFNLILQILASNGAPKSQPESGFVYVLTTVGGLVSALVIAQLSVTKPGEAPGVGGFQPESTVGIYVTNTVVAIYLFVWIFTVWQLSSSGSCCTQTPSRPSRTLALHGLDWPSRLPTLISASTPRRQRRKKHQLPETASSVTQQLCKRSMKERSASMRASLN